MAWSSMDLHAITVIRRSSAVGPFWILSGNLDHVRAGRPICVSAPTLPAP